VSPSSKSKKTPARRPAPRRPAPPAKRSKAKPAPKARPKPVAKKPITKKLAKATPKTPARPAAKGSARPANKSEGPSGGAAAAPPPRPGDARRHVLSLSFLRDGDEFLARIETDGGQITELKNRALDQLLTLVAGELEDLLE